MVLQSDNIDDVDIIGKSILTFTSTILDDTLGANKWNMRIIALISGFILGIIRLVMGNKYKVDWYAVVHAIITGVGGCMCVYIDFYLSSKIEPELIQEPNRTVQSCYGPISSLHKIVPAITMGYALFDLIDGIKSNSLDFALHGIATLCVTAYFVENNVPQLLAPTLCMELSTIFLNFVRATFLSESQLLIVQLLFVLSFFVVRIVISPYYLYNLLIALYTYNVDDGGNDNNDNNNNCNFPKYMNEFILIFSIFFVSLNMFWFYKMIRKIIRTINKMNNKVENEYVTKKQN